MTRRLFRVCQCKLLEVNEVGNDTAAAHAWGTWNPVYRDVIIVDAEGNRVEAYNLTTYDLGNPDNYAALKAKLQSADGP